MTAQLHPNVQKLARFALTVSDGQRLSCFYEQALGCSRLATERCAGFDFEQMTGLQGGAAAITLGLGDAVIELLQFDRPGRPYPGAAISSDLCFQHFAIVVADMPLAYQRLSSVRGWTAISRDGPQKLPASSGGVTAFKFRDPDGHPLELLAFPDSKRPKHWKVRSKNDLFLGIDHSAISVSDTRKSTEFYQGLGLHVAGSSFNTGPEQARLDAVSDVEVEVTALECSQPTPHVELLCYRSTPHGDKPVLRSNDIATTRMVFETDGLSSEKVPNAQTIIDPDGHHLTIVTPSTISDPKLP